MECCSRDVFNDGIVRLNLECETCQRPGWTPGDGRFYDWPIISSDTLRLVAAPDPTFIHSLWDQPKRTRLDVMADAWNIVRRHRIEARLNELNDVAKEFGLQFVRLRASGNLVMDEPLLLTHIGYQGMTDMNIPECTYGSVHGTSIPETAFQVMSDDLVSLKERLAHRDASERNRPASTGLREKQLETIKTVLETTGNFTVGSLPTGSGKTRIAQSIAWALRRNQQGPMLMISPLISLMDDQRAQWRAFSEDLQNTDLAVHEDRGFHARFLTSVEETPTLTIMTEINKGEVDLLCCSPETLMSSFGDHPMWIDRLTSLDNPVSCLVIDEAHVVGDWGASIRPDFQLLGWVKDRLLRANPHLRVLLLSATISVNEGIELSRLFQRGLEPKPTVRDLVTREDLYFHVEVQNQTGEFDFANPINRIREAYESIPLRWFEDQVQSCYRPPCIIYTPQKSHAEGVVSQLVRERFEPFRRYTGNTSNEQRETIRDDFISNRFECLVATSAFGMGIDKPDVWISAYLGMPFTVKGLYQGFGRAARNSRWQDNADVTQRRNGVCYAVLPSVQPRSFRAQLGKPKSLERMYDLFCSASTIFLPNGFVLLPIMENIDFAAWHPSQEFSEILASEQEVETDETDDTQDDYMIQQTVRTERERVLDELAKLKRFQALYNLRLWVLACLNRTSSVEFLGIHRSVLLQGRTGSDSISLDDVLNSHGYNGVLDHLNNIPNGFFRANHKNNRRYAVLKFNKMVANWGELAEIMVEGHELLHRRHTSGREELKAFIKGVNEGKCIRQLFAPTIGAMGNNAQACSQMLEAIPCSNCRAEMLEEPFTWSNIEFMEKMNWIDNVSEDFDPRTMTCESFTQIELDLPSDGISRFIANRMAVEMRGVAVAISLSDCPFQFDFVEDIEMFQFSSEGSLEMFGTLIYNGEAHEFIGDISPQEWVSLTVFENQKFGILR